jgi:hypothetical protein
MTYRISGNSLGDVDHSRTQQEAVIRKGAAVLIAGNEYAVKSAKWSPNERMVFVGKIFERNSCWNGTAEKCTYRGHLLFAHELGTQSLEGWYPIIVQSNLIWGDWEPYRKSIEEAEAKRRKEWAGTIKHNSQLIKEVREAALKLGFSTDRLDHISPETNYRYTPESFYFNMTGADVLKAAKELKKK